MQSIIEEEGGSLPPSSSTHHSGGGTGTGDDNEDGPGSGASNDHSNWDQPLIVAEPDVKVCCCVNLFFIEASLFLVFPLLFTA